MNKKSRNFRLGERTWSQLEALQGWLQVENFTRVIEVLAEKEYTIMSKSQNEQVLEKYKRRQIIRAEHPNGEMQQAEITALTAGDYNRLDGVMVRFSDGVFIQVPASRLEPDGTGQA